MAKRPETQFAKNGDLSIAYQVVGEGPLDLVFVPGYISHVELNWEYVFIASPLERLANIARVVVFDKRGSGLSDRSLGSGTLEDRLGDICAVMDAAGLDRAAIAAVSNGAPLAAALAAMCPERVTSLVLAMPPCPGVRPPDPSSLETILEWVGKHWATGHVANVLVQHPPDPDAAIAQLSRFERYCCTPSVAVEILRRGAESDLRPFLGHIQAPTLVVNQRDDPIVAVDEGTYLAEHIPDARHVILDGDFHASWKPADYDDLLRVVEEFLTGERTPSVVTPDRILSTVLFTDIVRSTDQLAEVGDATWRAVLDRYEDLCVTEVSRHGGVLVKQTGDGMLAHFDGPGRAVACALAINERVGSLGLRTRSGVHTGEVELRGADISGLAVHIAARVMATAEAGEVRVSRTVKDLTIGSDLEFSECGEHELKGVPGSWALYAVR